MEHKTWRLVLNTNVQIVKRIKLSQTIQLYSFKRHLQLLYKYIDKEDNTLDKRIPASRSEMFLLL